jgi:hypothetical protein
MAEGAGTVRGREWEGTSLLRGEGRAVDDGSEELLMGEGREEAVTEDKANQQVGRRRGLLIILSLWGLIFLQGSFVGTALVIGDGEDESSTRIVLMKNAASNMSVITTTQSKIAEDLDAFAEASWFTSAYLVSSSSLFINWILTISRSPCLVYHLLLRDWLKSSPQETASLLHQSSSPSAELSHRKLRA